MCITTFTFIFSYSINRISRLEHRQMFEMKVAREREEKELLKRKWEEEEKNYWLQQNQNLYYSGQTSSQMMTGNSKNYYKLEFQT